MCKAGQKRLICQFMTGGAGWIRQQDALYAALVDVGAALVYLSATVEEYY